MADFAWPELPYSRWKDTYETLHMWMQVVGKVEWRRHRHSITAGAVPCTSPAVAWPLAC